MTTLLLLGALIALVAVAVTIHAFVSARDGYEDDIAFHAMTPSPVFRDEQEEDPPSGNSSGDAMPPFAAAG